MGPNTQGASPEKRKQGLVPGYPRKMGEMALNGTNSCMLFPKDGFDSLRVPPTPLLDSQLPEDNTRQKLAGHQ